MQDPRDPGTIDWISGDCRKQIWFNQDAQQWYWRVWVLNQERIGHAEKLSEAEANADAMIERLCIQQENHDGQDQRGSQKDS